MASGCGSGGRGWCRPVGGVADGVVEVGDGEPGRWRHDRAVGSWGSTPSRRTRAWKWTRRVRWISATLPWDSYRGHPPDVPESVTPDAGDAALPGEVREVPFRACVVRCHSSPGVEVPDDLVVVVVAVQAQRLPSAVVVGVRGGAQHTASRPCGQRSVSRRAWHGSGRQSHRSGRCRCASTTRVWTGPKEGAVKVANTAGCAATVAGTPLPPTRPARRSW